MDGRIKEYQGKETLTSTARNNNEAGTVDDHQTVGCSRNRRLGKGNGS